MSFKISQISPNVWSIMEQDEWNRHPYMYLVVGDKKVLLIDTGCGCGNLYTFVKRLPQVGDREIIVVCTHNHAEQTGGAWRFSTTGKMGLAHRIESMCASRRHPYYTKLLDSSFHWQVRTYKTTHWLDDGEAILLGPAQNGRNVLQVLWTPGHTPDSMVLWYPADNRLFVGDLIYRFEDIMFTYDYTDIKEAEASVRKVLNFVKKQGTNIRYSSAKRDSDCECHPVFKHYHRFLLAVLSGNHQGIPLTGEDLGGYRYETRDKAMRIVLCKRIVDQLRNARQKAQERNGCA